LSVWLVHMRVLEFMDMSAMTAAAAGEAVAMARREEEQQRTEHNLFDKSSETPDSINRHRKNCGEHESKAKNEHTLMGVSDRPLQTTQTYFSDVGSYNNNCYY